MVLYRPPPLRLRDVEYRIVSCPMRFAWRRERLGAVREIHTESMLRSNRESKMATGSLVSRSRWMSTPGYSVVFGRRACELQACVHTTAAARLTSLGSDTRDSMLVADTCEQMSGRKRSETQGVIHPEELHEYVHFSPSE